MEELRRIRKERGLSQAKLAALSGLDPSTVNQIERGARKPGTASLERLAGALEVEVADLFRGYELPPKVQASLFEQDGQRRSPEAVRDGYARIIEAWAEHIRARARSWESAEPGTPDERTREEARSLLGASRVILGTVESVAARDAVEDPRPLVQSLLDILSEMDRDLGRIGQGYETAPSLGPAGSSPEWSSDGALLRHVNNCSDPVCEICHPSGASAEDPDGDPEAQERRAVSVEELPRSAS